MRPLLGEKRGTCTSRNASDASRARARALALALARKTRLLLWVSLGRGGKVKATVVPKRKEKALQSEVRKHVEAVSALDTDALLSYEGLAGDYAHQVVDRAVKYVDGTVHTNGLEKFWSLLKRGINGTYVSIEPLHLFRYLDEQSLRSNYRNVMDDQDRFSLALSQVTNKRLTYEHLTGKDRDPEPSSLI